MQDNKRNWESVSSQMELQIANSEKGHTTSSQLLSEKKLSLKTNIETERQSGRDAEVGKPGGIFQHAFRRLSVKRKSA